MTLRRFVGPTRAGIAVGLVAAVLVVGFWQILVERERRATVRAVHDRAMRIAERFQAALERQVEPLVWLSEEWKHSPESGALSRARAEAIVRARPAIFALAWAGPDGRVVWVAPSDSAPQAEGTDLASEPRRRSALERARERRSITFTHPLQLVTGDPGVLAFLPRFLGEELQGYAIEALRSRNLVETAATEAGARGYAIDVRDGNETIYSKGVPSPQSDSQGFSESVNVTLHGTTWTVAVRPTPAMLEELGSPMQTIVLVAGLAAALLLGLLTHSRAGALARARDLEAANVRLEEGVVRTREVEDRLRIAHHSIERARDSILWVERDGRIGYANDAAHLLLGYGPGQLLGRPLGDVCPGRSLTDWASESPGDAGSVAGRTLCTLRRCDGRDVPVEVSVGRIDAADERLCLFVRDRTPRIAAERALRASEEYLRTVIENVTDVILCLDEAGRITYVSPSCHQTTGFPPSEYLGKLVTAVVHPEDVAATAEGVSRAARNPGEIVAAEIRLPHKDGTWRTLRSRGRRVGARNDDLRIVVSVRDVTAEREREAALAWRAQLSELGTVFQTSPTEDSDLPSVLRRGGEAVAQLSQAAAVHIWLQATEPASGRARQGPFGTNRYHGLLDEPSLDRITRLGKPLRVDRAEGDPPGDRSAWATVAGIPLTVDGAALGVVVVAWSRRPDDAVVETLESLAPAWASAIRERQLRETMVAQQALLRYVLDNIPHFVFWKDRSLVFQGCNRAFARACGFDDPAAIVGKSDHDMPWKPEETEGYRACDRTVMQTGAPLLDVEETQLRADGSQAVLLTSKIPMRNPAGEVIGVLGVFADITERRREEEQRRLLFAAIEHAGEAIVITDATGVIQYVNPAFEAATGYGRAEAVGVRPSVLKSGTHPDAFYRDLWATILRGQVWKGRFHNRRKDGTPFEEEATISPVLDDTGTLRNFVAVKRNITAELELESKLRNAQKLEAVGQLAAGIAHEINTPAQYVGDNLQFLKDSFRDLLAMTNPSTDGTAPDEDAAFLVSEIPRAIDQSLEGVGRITKIVRAMKEFSHRSDDKAPTDINRAIETTVTVARNEWKYVAEVVTDFDPELPQVECLRGELNQVVLNMIVNAAHAIADVVGDASNGKGTITIATRHADGWAEIRISDTGTGIPESIRDRIFDPFFTTKEVGKGSGQGLAIAHSVVVQKHGGTISLESAPGTGATFVIRVPVTDPARVAAEVTG